MKKITLWIPAVILAILAVFFLCSAERQSGIPRLWLGGLELTEGGSFEAGGGTVDYLPEEQRLTLHSVSLHGTDGAAGLRCDGDLTLILDGDSSFTGDRDGIVILGSLSVGGSGTLSASGDRSGAAVRGSLLLFDSGSLRFTSAGQPLRWGSFHGSTLNRVEKTRHSLLILAPCTVTLTDGSLDVAGHSLIGSALFERFCLRSGDPLPRPEDPNREGYRFDGWYLDSGLTQPCDFTQSCTASLTLYAAWNQLITIHYDSWGGSEVPDSVTTWGQYAPAPETPDRAGFRFLGWFADPELTQPYYSHEPQTRHRVVYAAWERCADVIGQGVDLARYQGVVDWTALAETEDFAFIRLGYRGYGTEGALNLDDHFEMNLEGALAAGIPVGVYFFSQATSAEEAVEEARFVLEALQGRQLQLPVVIDYELATTPDGRLLGRLYEAGLSGTEHGAICAAFCREIERQHYTAAVYAGVSLLESGAAEVLAAEGYPVWLANWSVQTRYNGDFFCWQYTSSGTAAGIEGAVDRNEYYLRIPEAVTGLKVSTNRKEAVLSWERIPGVRGYILYRAEKGSSEYTEIARLQGAADTGYTDPAYTPGCTYRVRAYLTLGARDFIGN